MTFLDSVIDLESGNRNSTPSKNVVHAGGKRKANVSEAEAQCLLRPKIVAFESGDGSDEESVALQNEIERANSGKTLTEFGLSQLDVMARAKAQELGPDSNVVSSDGMVCVPTVGSSRRPPDIGAVRTENYPSHFEKV